MAAAWVSKNQMPGSPVLDIFSPNLGKKVTDNQAFENRTCLGYLKTGQFWFLYTYCVFIDYNKIASSFYWKVDKGSQFIKHNPGLIFCIQSKVKQAVQKKEEKKKKRAWELS